MRTRFYVLNSQGKRGGLIQYREQDSRESYFGALKSVNGVGIRHGLGELVFRDGLTYAGEWVMNVPAGRGPETYGALGIYAGIVGICALCGRARSYVRGAC